MMSELQIVIPLSLLAGAQDLSTEGIIAYLEDTRAAREAMQHYKDQYNALAERVRSAGNSLTLILDEVNDDFERAKALRNFAQEMKQEQPLEAL